MLYTGTFLGTILPEHRPDVGIPTRDSNRYPRRLNPFSYSEDSFVLPSRSLDFTLRFCPSRYDRRTSELFRRTIALCSQSSGQGSRWEDTPSKVVDGENVSQVVLYVRPDPTNFLGLPRLYGGLNFYKERNPVFLDVLSEIRSNQDRRSFGLQFEYRSFRRLIDWTREENVFISSRSSVTGS